MKSSTDGAEATALLTRIQGRGIYGGTIGYFDFLGNVDSCIAIRTAVIKDSVAYVQAGAGIVADSIPELEDAECSNKAAAVLGAISTANELRVLGAHE